MRASVGEPVAECLGEAFVAGCEGVVFLRGHSGIIIHTSAVESGTSHMSRLDADEFGLDAAGDLGAAGGW